MGTCLRGASCPYSHSTTTSNLAVKGKPNADNGHRHLASPPDENTAFPSYLATTQPDRPRAPPPDLHSKTSSPAGVVAGAATAAVAVAAAAACTTHDGDADSSTAKSTLTKCLTLAALVILFFSLVRVLDLAPAPFLATGSPTSCALHPICSKGQHGNHDVVATTTTTAAVRVNSAPTHAFLATGQHGNHDVVATNTTTAAARVNSTPAHAVVHTSSTWHYDTGTGRSISNDRSDFSSLSSPNGNTVQTGGGNVPVTAIGTLNAGSLPPVKSGLLCPSFPTKLVAGIDLDERGHAALTQGGRTYIFKHHLPVPSSLLSTLLATFSITPQRIYALDPTPVSHGLGTAQPSIPTPSFLAQTYVGDLNAFDLWHQRTHLADAELRKYIPDVKKSKGSRAASATLAYKGR